MINLAIGTHFIRIQVPKLSPMAGDKIQAILYAQAHINLGPLLLCGILEFSYDEVIENRMFQTTRIRKIAPGREVRQESYRATQYEKPRQDAGVFYALYFQMRPGWASRIWIKVIHQLQQITRYKLFNDKICINDTYPIRR